MTRDEKITLLCKDTLVQEQGSMLLSWSELAWRSSVTTRVMVFNTLERETQEKLLSRLDI